MEVPESLERTGDSVPTSYFFSPPVVKFTEIPDTHVVPRPRLCHRLDQLKRESSERIGSIIPTSYTNFPPVTKFTELHDSEEMRMINQARLGNKLRRKVTRRFRDEGRYTSADSSDVKKSATSGSVTSLFGGPRPPVELQIHEEHRVMKLTNVCLLHPTKAYPGTLEVHTNGFIYTASGLRSVFMNANVDGCFVRLGDRKFPPLLLFHLQHPIMFETKQTKDIQFSLRQPIPGIIDEKLSEDLKSFIQKVSESHWRGRWSTVPITPIEFEALEECECVGVLPTGISVTFSLTYSALVVLEGRPFMVFPLHDIEIVNLALSQPEEKKKKKKKSSQSKIIEMTVIFKDLKHPLLEIRSVSSKFLTSIKHRLNIAQVKYYVNSEIRDWNSTVRKMFESSEAFIHETSRLEDSRTLAYYPDADPGSDSEFLEKYSSLQLCRSGK